jgi:ferredoxin
MTGLHFTAPQVVEDGAFDIVLKTTGIGISIPTGASTLDGLIDAGVDPVHDCKRGDVEVCQMGFLDGIADHKDRMLNASEKAADKAMQICFSRSKSPRLVLNL